MPDLHEDEPAEPVEPSDEAPTPRLIGPPEVEALHQIDELIGNSRGIDSRRLGEVRGIVLDTLNAWHTKVRERQQIVAGGRPGPLPSELLESLEGGAGIAAFVLTPEALDRLPVLAHRAPRPHPADERVFDDVDEALAALTVDPREFVSVAEANRVLAEERAAHARHAAEWDQRSAEGRRQVERLVAANTDLRQQLAEFRASLPGPMPASDAEALRLLREERDDARRQLIEQGEAAEEQADALRSEVARLTGLLDAQDDLNRSILARLHEFTRNLAAEDWSDRAGDWQWLQARPRKIAASIEEHVLGERVDPLEVVVPELLGRAEASPHPIAEDPRRPSLDHYPEDAILLTYRELRQLLALHLARYGASPEAVRAVREGDVPLRLAEVLDR